MLIGGLKRSGKALSDMICGALWIEFKENAKSHNQRRRRQKIFFPRITKAPVVKYSPVGAVLETWCECTHQADVTTLAFQAFDLQIESAPAATSVFGCTSFPEGFLIKQEAAPWISACTKYRFFRDIVEKVTHFVGHPDRR